MKNWLIEVSRHSGAVMIVIAASFVALNLFLLLAQSLQDGKWLYNFESLVNCEWQIAAFILTYIAAHGPIMKKLESLAGIDDGMKTTETITNEIK